MVELKLQCCSRYYYVVNDVVVQRATPTTGALTRSDMVTSFEKKPSVRKALVVRVAARGID